VPIQFKRLQLPIKLAFVMTINKSQGQTISVCGLDLSTLCFSHGQLRGVYYIPRSHSLHPFALVSPFVQLPIGMPDRLIEPVFGVGNEPRSVRGRCDHHREQWRRLSAFSRLRGHFILLQSCHLTLFNNFT
jgi:hypothetical protein